MNAFVCTARVAPEQQTHRLLAAAPFRGGLGEDMATKMTYREQLLHPNWQRRRLERLEAAGWKCSACLEKDRTLHVHHKRYVKGRLAWEYEDPELAVLCDECHDSAHETRDELLRIMCYAETFSPAGITEADLVTLNAAFLFSAAGGVPDEHLAEAAATGSLRILAVANMAGMFHSSELSLSELGDLPMLLSQAGLSGLRTLLAEARAEVERQVNEDRGLNA